MCACPCVPTGTCMELVAEGEVGFRPGGCPACSAHLCAPADTLGPCAELDCLCEERLVQC